MHFTLNQPFEDGIKNTRMALSRMLPLMSEKFEWISLQKEVRPADQPVLATAGIRTFAEHLHDFADTAALCSLMDLVISVDTSVAHLAGALGIPLFVLLPFAPDWRWMLTREDCPWYPTMQLFRQDKGGDWQAPISRVAEALKEI